MKLKSNARKLKEIQQSIYKVRHANKIIQS